MTAPGTAVRRSSASVADTVNTRAQPRAPAQRRGPLGGRWASRGSAGRGVPRMSGMARTGRRRGAQGGPDLGFGWLVPCAHLVVGQSNSQCNCVQDKPTAVGLLLPAGQGILPFVIQRFRRMDHDSLRDVSTAHARVPTPGISPHPLLCCALVVLTNTSANDSQET